MESGDCLCPRVFPHCSPFHLSSNCALHLPILVTDTSSVRICCNLSGIAGHHPGQSAITTTTCLVNRSSTLNLTHSKRTPPSPPQSIRCPTPPVETRCCAAANGNGGFPWTPLHVCPLLAPSAASIMDGSTAISGASSERQRDTARETEPQATSQRQTPAPIRRGVGLGFGVGTTTHTLVRVHDYALVPARAPHDATLPEPVERGWPGWADPQYPSISISLS